MIYGKKLKIVNGEITWQNEIIIKNKFHNSNRIIEIQKVKILKKNKSTYFCKTTHQDFSFAPKNWWNKQKLAWSFRKEFSIMSLVKDFKEILLVIIALFTIIFMFS